jgi:hypothetical protein
MSMSLPSLGKVSADLRRTLLRFPLVVLAAAVGTAAAIILIDREGPMGSPVLSRLLLASGIGVPLLSAVALMREKMTWGAGRTVGANGAGLLLLASYAVTVPADLENAPALHAIRFLLLSVAAVMLVSVGPYLRRGEVNGFWHFNKSLFLRILVALLYAHVLFAGLALALGALDNLFGLDVPGKTYAELWALLAGFFTTLFFLAGVPEDLPALERRTDYPKGLRVFAQYILLPLVLIYLVILYAYVAKILFSWEWPVGWVSKLILGFSGTGIFALLLLHPLSGQTENRWIRNAPRRFAVALVPLIVMLFLALLRRLGEYGITEGRYLAFGLGAWLVMLASAFLFTRSWNIKLLPATLGLLALLVSYGPWGVFSVSEQSQVGRLERILNETGVLREGTVVKATSPIPFEQAREVSALLSYLRDFHGYASIQSWFSQELKEAGTETEPMSPAGVAQLMGIEYVSRWFEADAGILVFRADREASTPIGGYTSMLRWQSVSSPHRARSFDSGTFSYRTGGKIDSLVFVYAPAGRVPDSLVLDLGPTVRNVVERFGRGNTEKVPPEQMQVEKRGGTFDVVVSLWQLRVEKEPGTLHTLSYDAEILYRPAVGSPPEGSAPR